MYSGFGVGGGVATLGVERCRVKCSVTFGKGQYMLSVDEITRCSTVLEYSTRAVLKNKKPGE